MFVNDYLALTLAVRKRNTALLAFTTEEEWKTCEQLLCETKAFVESGSWSRSEKTFKKFMLYLSFGAEGVKSTFNLSDCAVENTIRRQSEILDGLLGKDYLSLIKLGDFANARLQLECATGTLCPATLFLKDVTERLPNPVPHPEIRLSDCKLETRLLHFYSLLLLDKRFQDVDMKKLEHLIALLVIPNSTYNEEKNLLVGVLTGKMSFDNFVEATKNLY